MNEQNPTVRQNATTTIIALASITDEFKKEDVIDYSKYLDKSNERTVYRTLKSLSEENYLDHDPGSHTYRQGYKLKAILILGKVF